MRRPTAVIAFALCTVGLVRPASAWRGPDPDVRWEAPAACPDRAAVIDALRRATTSIEALPPGWSADATVVARPDRRWSVHLVLREGDRVLGERDLVERDCRRLADASAVVMSLSLQEAAARAPAQPVVAAVTVTSSPAHDGERPPGFGVAPARAPEPARSRWRPWVRGAIGVDLTTTPGVSPGVVVSGGARLGRLVLGAEVSGWGARDTSTTPGQTAVTSVEAYTAALRVGWAPSWSWGSLAVTAGPLLGLVRGRSSGIAEPRDDTGVWVAAQLSAAVCARVGAALSVCAEPQGTVTLREPVFVVEGLGAVHRVGAFGFRALLGVQWSIP